VIALFLRKLPQSTKYAEFGTAMTQAFHWQRAQQTLIGLGIACFPNTTMAGEKLDFLCVCVCEREGCEVPEKVECAVVDRGGMMMDLGDGPRGWI